MPGSFGPAETLASLRAEAFWDISSLAASGARPGTAGAEAAILLPLPCVALQKEHIWFR